MCAMIKYNNTSTTNHKMNNYDTANTTISISVVFTQGLRRYLKSKPVSPIFVRFAEK